MKYSIYICVHIHICIYMVYCAQFVWPQVIDPNGCSHALGGRPSRATEAWEWERGLDECTNFNI